MNKSFLLATSLFFLPSIVMAQTPLPAMPNGGGNQAQNAQQNPLNNAPPIRETSQSVPLPEAVINQAVAQFNGNFPSMTQKENIGGQIQEAWNKAPDNAGIISYNHCRDCVYRVRSRQYMITAFELPDFEEIATIDVGDPNSFLVETRSDHQFAVKPIGYGMDTNLIVYTRSGRTYPFYIRSENTLSPHISDLVVRIGGEAIRPIEVTSPQSARQFIDEHGQEVIDIEGWPKATKGNLAFDPTKMHGFNDYEIWGNSNQLKPYMVYRDDLFTYIYFGDAVKGMEFPTAFVVVDEIDEIVNTRIENDGKLLIIESVHDLITLKSGTSYICINYKGAA